jgi:hypothetical protein
MLDRIPITNVDGIPAPGLAARLGIIQLTTSLVVSPAGRRV